MDDVPYVLKSEWLRLTHDYQCAQDKIRELGEAVKDCNECDCVPVSFLKDAQAKLAEHRTLLLALRAGMSVAVKQHGMAPWQSAIDRIDQVTGYQETASNTEAKP